MAWSSHRLPIPSKNLYNPVTKTISRTQEEEEEDEDEEEEEEEEED